MRRVLPVIIFAVALAACGKPGSGSQEAAAPAAAPPPPESSAADKQKLLAALPAPYNAADLSHGEALFGVCRACHTVTYGVANMTGPNLHGVIGRPAGSEAGYAYSPALKAAGFVWDAQKIDVWLAEPRTFLPGTKMTFPGLKDAKDRTDVIAYLMTETGFQP